MAAGPTELMNMKGKPHERKETRGTPKKEQHKRRRNEGKRNITYDVGSMGGWGEGTQDKATRGRISLSNRGLDFKP